MPFSFEDHTFEKADFASAGLPAKEFINCIFNGCNFAGTDLTGADFFDCTFNNCNLGLVKLKGTGLKDVRFSGSKITGVDFTPTNNFLFSVSFTDCVLDYSAFQQKKMKKTIFRNTSMKETHFSGNDLSESVFDRCDLTEALFQDNNLEKADFRSALNYFISPNQNKLKKARFSIHGLPGLLSEWDLVIE